MGGQQTKSTNSAAGLNEHERSQLKSLFLGRIRGDKGSHPDTCSKDAFQKYCHTLDDWLSERISAIISVKSKGLEIIPLEEFLIFVSAVLKGDFDERIAIIFRICAENNIPKPQATVSGSSILQYTRSIVTSYERTFKGSDTWKSWARCLNAELDTTALGYYLLQDLLYPCGPPKDYIVKNQESSLPSRQFTFDELVTGLAKSMLFQNISNSVFSRCFEFNMEGNIVKDLIPYCLKVQPALISSHFTILDFSRLIFLNSLLPSEFRQKWRFLFSSATNGESFSKCLNCIQQNGATILVIRDNHSRVFGGFAALSWKLGPKFFGTAQSFLFHLSPRLTSYSVTGYNENYQYLNIQQKTLPNGLGMGGTLEYFGLWVDSEYGKGTCSPSCTTFSCPQLSTEKEFVITHLEVWGVGPEPQKEEGIRQPQSVLDKDPELRAVLEIMGKKPDASDGFRDLSDAD